MATRTASIVVYAIGLALILGAVWVLFTQTGLSRWIPGAVLVALILLILGIGVMAMSDRFRGGTAVVRETSYGPAPGPGPVTYEREVHRTEDYDRRL